MTINKLQLRCSSCCKFFSPLSEVPQHGERRIACRRSETGPGASPARFSLSLSLSLSLSFSLRIQLRARAQGLVSASGKLMIHTRHVPSRKEGLCGQPRPGVDSNVSAWSRLSVVAAHTAISPGVCAPTRRFPLGTISRAVP